MESTHQDEKEDSACCVKFRRVGILPTMFMLAMVLGVSTGFLVRHVDPSFTDDPRKRMYLGFLGHLMINMLKEIILPLVITCLIAGVGGMPREAAGALGWRMILYYMGTTFTAVVIGIIFVTAIQPGNFGDDITVGVDRGSGTNPMDSILDLIRNLFPPNLIEACFNQIKTVAETTTTTMVHATIEYRNGTSENIIVSLEEKEEMEDSLDSSVIYNISVLTSYNQSVETISQTMSGGTNTLGLIVFAIVFGLMISKLGERGKPLLEIFTLMQDVVIKIITVMIWFCPIGIWFLLAEKIVAMDDPKTSFTQLAFYMATVAAGLAAHFFVVLPLVYFIFTRKNPYTLMAQMSPALLLAISTASSSATMPVTLKSLKERAGVNPMVANFMIPVGATINMDGTALYEAVACIFIAQYNNISLDIGQVIIVAITATAAAIGAAGVPEAGLVTMLIVLTAVGLPTEDVGLIYAVDWLLDRLRTTTNVWGDAVGAATVAHTVRHQLNEESAVVENGAARKHSGQTNDAFETSDEKSSYL